jgi:type VI secretion system protein VasJ
VRLSETLLVMVPHWLELCFITAQALRELGSEYAAARAAVERETRALHARIPELAQRSFRDGSALAPAEVVQWLNVGQRSTEVATLPAEPRAADDSMEGLMRELQEAPSPRARFLQRCKLARAFVASGEAERAKFVYRGLLHEVDAFALERWEPALALDVVQPLRALIEPRTPGGVKDAEAEALYVRLARLAPWMELKRSDGKSA